MLTIYHNKNCSKSCSALDFITKSRQEFNIISYLDEVPSIAELEVIIAKIQCKPYDLIRTNEPVYLEKFKGKDLTDAEWIIAMHENPILIQRPIIVNGEKATIARSEEAVKKAI